MEPHEDTRPIEVYASQSPDSGSVPFWVTACVRLLKPGPPRGSAKHVADRVITVVQMLDADRIKVGGDEAFALDRDAIAAMAGYTGSTRAKNSRWIVSFLQKIGYLQVHQQWKKGGGRDVDQFTVSPRPPLNYVGPRTLAGTVRALREERDWMWSDLFSQVNQWDADAHLGSEQRDASAYPGSFSQVNQWDADAHLGSAPLIKEGNFVPQGTNEVPSFKEGGAARLRGADGPAGEEDDELTAEVRRLAHRLPWSKTLGRTLETMHQVDALLVPAMVRAIRDYGLSLEAAREHALNTLAGGKAKTVGYVAGSFEAHRIPMPVPDDELPLASPKSPVKPSEINRGGSNGTRETCEANQGGAAPQKRSQPVSEEVSDSSAELAAAREVLAELAVPGYTAKQQHLGAVAAAIAEHGRDRVAAHLRAVVASAGDPVTRLDMVLPNLLVALNDAASSN